MLFLFKNYKKLRTLVFKLQKEEKTHSFTLITVRSESDKLAAEAEAEHEEKVTSAPSESSQGWRAGGRRVVMCCPESSEGRLLKLGAHFRNIFIQMCEWNRGGLVCLQVNPPHSGLWVIRLLPE